MLSPGRAYKVSVYLNKDSSAETNFLHEAVRALLQERSIAGLTTYLPFAGFGPHQQLHRQGDGPVNGEHLPILLVFIDVEERVRAILPELKTLVTDGLIEMHPVEIIQHTFRDGRVDGR
ncbi:DUF190 domain-containing protein [Acidipila sp. EB88]|uniref:DUF190 domain-containing protein n=1 Tax=Acidipila sp. EB88 TaxID=2305226 RepID=UPI000F5FE405|nr:DUF190 domain-containing protein [Acidipila sp. EB88]RRA49158.1 DUF190 domain-containing protein [Acidipila sp. EB88]